MCFIMNENDNISFDVKENLTVYDLQSFLHAINIFYNKVYVIKR